MPRHFGPIVPISLDGCEILSLHGSNLLYTVATGTTDWPLPPGRVTGHLPVRQAIAQSMMSHARVTDFVRANWPKRLTVTPEHS